MIRAPRLIRRHHADRARLDPAPATGGATALLLLCAFANVKIAVLVLRRDKVEQEHFRTPTVLPIVRALSCAFLTGPWTGRASVQYMIAGVLIGNGQRAADGRYQRGGPVN